MLLAAWLSAGGCAAVVPSADREALWRAALRAVELEGYQITESSAGRGYIIAKRSVVGDDLSAGELRLGVYLRPAREGYEAAVVVRRTLVSPTFVLTESITSEGRLYRRETARVASEYGTMPTRDEVAERAVRKRMRAILIAMEPAANKGGSAE